jgi:hypothetical protein
VTLTSTAPSGGVAVQLASSNSTIARVPATVLVAGGQTSASFAINTSTVGNNSQITITANYGGAVRTAALTVMPPQLEAVYTVTSASMGPDACVLGPDTDQTDCTLDATASRGFIDRWVWTYWMGGAPIGVSASEGRASLRIATHCDFLQTAQGGTDAAGNNYLQMTVELIVQDRIGTRSAPVRRAVRLYPNRLCGFRY